MRNSLAIFGFSANPPHCAHMRIVETLAEATDLCDRVVVVPCGMRADKPDFTSGYHRYQMVMQMCQSLDFRFGNLVFDAGDIFSDQAETTIQLMMRLTRAYPEHELKLVMGADLLVAREELGGMCHMETWEEGHSLMNRWTVLITRRPGVSTDALRLPKRHAFVDTDFPDVSSTDIRERIVSGDSLAGLVPNGVEEYIRANNLYRDVEHFNT